MASMKSSSSSSSAAAAAVTRLISRCSVGSTISLTSNSSMRYEGVVESVHLPDEVICLNNVRSFGTEGRRKDSALVLPDDRVFDNVQFRGSDIKELQVLSGSPAVQVLAFPHDPAIIQYCPLRPASTLEDSARDINCSCADDCDLNIGSRLTIKESLPSASPMHTLMSFSASKLSTNNGKPPTQGVSGILGGATCVCPHNSMDMQPTLAEHNWKRPTQSSGDNVFPNRVLSSQVPLTSSTPFQTGPPCIVSSLASLPKTSSTRNLSPDVIPTFVACENFQTPSLSFGSSGTITGKDTYAVSLQMVDRSSPLLGSCVPPQSLSQSMDSKNQIIETIHLNKLELSSQESPNHVFPTGPLAVSYLHLRGSVPEDMEPLKNLVPCSGSTESKGCSELISSLSTHAKTSSSALKSASQATTMSSSLLSAKKLLKSPIITAKSDGEEMVSSSQLFETNKGNMHDNMKVAGQPRRNIPMFRSGKDKVAGQTYVDSMKNASTDSHTFQRRQPRKICSFGRTNKVSQLPTNYWGECYVRSVNGKSDETGVDNHSSEIEQAPLKSEGNTRNIYVRKSEKVHPKDDLSVSPVTSEWELGKRNSKIPDQAEANGGSAGDRKDRPSGRFPKLRGCAGGTGRGGHAGRSQAESVGKHIT